MTIEITNAKRTVWQIGFSQDVFRFDLAVQRNEGIWDLEHKSLFIHSMLYGYPIPEFYAEEKVGERELWILDGKQRLTTILTFINNEFALSPKTPDVHGEKVAGLTYSELSYDLQIAFNSTSLGFTLVRGMTNDERNEMFFRLNFGVSLSAQELLRAYAKDRVMEFVQEVAGMMFFKEIINIPQGARKRFADEEIVIQVMYVLSEGGAVSLSARNLKRFVASMQETGVPTALQEMVRGITEYMTKAFPCQEIFLKRINVPILYFVATQAVAQRIAPERFGGWANSFFNSKRFRMTAYYAACTGGSTKKENVTKRINAMTKNFLTHIHDTKESRKVKVEIDGEFYDGEVVTVTQVNNAEEDKAERKGA